MSSNVDHVVKVMMDRITSGYWVDTIPTQESIAIEMGVSRTLLREAVAKLEHCGILQCRPKLGTNIRAKMYWNLINADTVKWMAVDDFDYRFLHDTIDLVCTLGPTVAVEFRDKLGLSMDAFKEMQDAVPRFHAKLFRMSSNKYFSQLEQITLDCLLKLDALGCNYKNDIGKHELIRDYLDRSDVHAPPLTRTDIVQTYETLREAYHVRLSFQQSKTSPALK